MRDPDEAELWMKQAEYDLQTASILQDAGRFDSACFMAEQSAQKALKAFLLSQSRKAVLKHSIAALCKIAAEYDGTFNKLLPKVKDLSRFYVETRYPDVLGVAPMDFFDFSDAERALSMAEEVIQTVKRHLEGGEEKT